jgi:1-acyl-sn-glycerol-3-phosphate acyltransferase
MTRVLLDGQDATDEARGHEVDAAVSDVARQPAVRSALLGRQRALAAAGGIVVAGRDIGTVVLPDAGLKIFLDASVEERASRRIEERGLDPAGAEAGEVREQLRARDAIDRGRAVAPLRAAEDAVVVRTDGNALGETVDLVTSLIVAAASALVVPPAGEPASVPPPAPEPERQPAPEPERQPEPAPTPEAAPEATPAAPRRTVRTSATEPARPTRRNAVLEAATRMDNDQSLLVRMVALISRICARIVANVEVQGLEKIPRTGAVILAANHISNVDPFVVGAWATPGLRNRRIHWLGKRELFDWPVFGWVCAHGGVHPVDRGTADVEAYRLATRILEAGYVLMIFPEGTRSPTGTLQEAKDGLAALAMRTGAAIVPIGVNDSDRVWPKGRKLPAALPRRTITVRIGDPFYTADVIPPGLDRRAAKSAATAVIMGRIAALLDPRHRGVYGDSVRASATTEP